MELGPNEAVPFPVTVPTRTAGTGDGELRISRRLLAVGFAGVALVAISVMAFRRRHGTAA